jgi:mRNA interferase RelE/StbE
MAWRVEFLPAADKELRALDAAVRKRILLFLRSRLATRDDPRSLGEPLRGPLLGKYWKYRVGDYRLICSLRDDRIVIVVIQVGHRREIYESSN